MCQKLPSGEKIDVDDQEDYKNMMNSIKGESTELTIVIFVPQMGENIEESKTNQSANSSNLPGQTSLDQRVGGSAQDMYAAGQDINIHTGMTVDGVQKIFKMGEQDGMQKQENVNNEIQRKSQSNQHPNEPTQQKEKQVNLICEGGQVKLRVCNKPFTPKEVEHLNQCGILDIFKQIDQKTLNGDLHYGKPIYRL